MSNNQEVTGQIEGNAIVLTVTYGPKQMIDPDAPNELAKLLTQKYDSLESGSKAKDCVVVINADIAGSPIVRALIELYILVFSKRGQVLLAEYPDAYFESLTSAALPDQPGFRTFLTKEDALREATIKT